jgi:hypothetical protein
MNGPFDYETEASALDRREKILQAMLQGSLAPMDTPQIGGVAGARHPLEAVARIAQAYMAKKGIQTVDDKRKQMQGRYAADLQSGLNRFLDESTVQPGAQPPQVGNNPSAYVAGSTLSPQEAQLRRRRAIVEAMASNHPILRQVGATAFQGMGKDQLSAKDILGLSNMDPASALEAVQAGNDPGKLRPKRETHVVNNQIVKVDGDSALPLADFGPKYGPVGNIATGPDGRPIVGQTELRSGKASFAPAPGATVNVDTQGTADKAFSKSLAEGRAKAITESFEKAKGVPQTVATLDEAANALRAGIKSGQLADVGLVMSKLSKSLGLGDVDPTIANTEEFRAKMAGSVLEILKTLRPASDKDVEYAEKAAGGKITLDDQAMLRLINSARAAGVNTWLGHSRLLDKNRDASGALPQDLATFEVPMKFGMDAEDFDFRNGMFMIKPPPGKPASGSSGAPMSLDQYLQSRQRGH